MIERVGEVHILLCKIVLLFLYYICMACNLQAGGEENDGVGTSLKMKNRKVNIIFSDFWVKGKYQTKITTNGSI